MRALLTPARIAAFATAFAFLVIVFGAFVRLSNAGLSCPDWPTCYGQATWPGARARDRNAPTTRFPSARSRTTRPGANRCTA